MTRRINDTTHTLVVIGKHANSLHQDRRAIGEDNWQHWEIAQSARSDNGFIAVKIARDNPTPPGLLGKGATWAMSFNVDALGKAIDEAP